MSTEAPQAALPAHLTARDWSGDLMPEEQLLWSGRPSLAPLCLMATVAFIFCLIVGPAGLIALAPASVLVGLYGRSAYALTDRRILAYSHPIFGTARVESMPRAGTYPRPFWTSSSNGISFTAQHRKPLKFAMLSRKTVKELIALYAQSERPMS
ncbi:hypothetical protein Q9295_13645 [Xinfangfangia sp. CPCC 101601]|uniref:DUF2244 domain-containing protein n=1 Tax=Pseudogemmobacter lacusdianii TaxID=3069608 RepID=A0ABU0W083_9RHOB|nr:hypothetical protein [Xinfangfangia sp. CPCC 101601]MDQ2067417.1 hypothetical protein [Xinfangfangia sp. CPCC 101601]